MSMEKNYGERTCLQCGAKFQAVYPAQLTCTQQCRASRRASVNRALSKRRRASHKQYVSGLEARISELEAQLEAAQASAAQETPAPEPGYDARITELEAEIAKLRTELAEAQSALKKAQTELGERDRKRISSVEMLAAAAGKRLYECERLHLKALKLPCGLNERCFTPPCENLPDKRKK